MDRFGQLARIAGVVSAFRRGSRRRLGVATVTHEPDGFRIVRTLTSERDAHDLGEEVARAVENSFAEGDVLRVDVRKIG
ncbi:hypothetical protein [Halegenticoccus tardaugens]|uniref:hypothetical protein n=1 Tax=Halegenticoccus tardaugens TaxID=2071624 RepID=UPI00100B6709|nr:hypothetical protein [Halegenticoccus tardaugens]